jgi:hypothetical protein
MCAYPRARLPPIREVTSSCQAIIADGNSIRRFFWACLKREGGDIHDDLRNRSGR